MLPGSENTKFTSLIFVAVVELAAGIGFFATRGFSQTPIYQQTASVDDGPLMSTPNIGTFGQNGTDSTASTYIEMLPVIEGGVQTLNGSSMSNVTASVSTTATASTRATYFVEVDTSVSPLPLTVALDVVGTLTGSAQGGEAMAFVGFGEAPLDKEFDISAGTEDIPFDIEAFIPPNTPQAIVLNTSATLNESVGSVSAEIDPYVRLDPSVQDVNQYKFTFVTTPVSEPASHALSVGGLGFLLAVLGWRRFLVV